MNRLFGRFALLAALLAGPDIHAQNPSFEMTRPVEGPGAPLIIGGVPANPKDFPATFILRTPSGGCTSTAVGSRTILTAAHCIDNGAVGTAKLSDSKTVRVSCEHHPDYSSNRTKDFALCLSDAELSGFDFETINTSIAYAAKGDDIRLVGYGCREEGGFDSNFGVLYAGPATVTRLPQGEDLDTITSGDAALCYGDSGGAAYVYLSPDGGSRVVFGINSRGNIKNTSYLSTTATSSFVDFAKDWAKRNATVICGVTINARNCRVQ